MTLEEQLIQLEAADLVRVAQRMPELEYLFRHTLVQDAAYSSLLKQDRRRLHHAVGAALEQVYPNRLDVIAPQLGEHFEEAGDDARALRYYTSAADRAAVQYANAEAAMLYARAIKVAIRSGAGGPTLIPLFSHHGRVLEISGRYDDALAVYDDLSRLGHERADASLKLAALLNSATIYSTPTACNNSERGKALSEQALQMARELSDHNAEAKALWLLMHLSYFNGLFTEAVRYGERSLAIAREYNLREQMAYTLNDLNGSYTVTGRLDRAGEALQEARGLWRELHNLPMLADNLSSSAERYYMVGDLDSAEALAREGLVITQRIGNRWGQSYSLMVIGFMLLERARFSAAVRVMQECVELGDEAGFIVAQVVTRALLGLLYGSLGMLDRAFEYARLSIDASRQLWPAGTTWGLPVLALLFTFAGDFDAADRALRETRAIDGSTPGASPSEAYIVPWVEAVLSNARGDHVRALSASDEYLTNARHTGIASFLIDAMLTRGQALLALGRAAEARETLREALALAESRHSTRSLYTVLGELSGVEASLGHLGEAMELRQRGRAVVQGIVAELDDVEIRQSFLKTPEVRRLLEG